MRDKFNNLDHKSYLDQWLIPAMKREPKAKTLRVVFEKTLLPMSLDWIPEWLVYVKGSSHRIGFDPTNVRKAENDDPTRIVRFFLDVVGGRLPEFSWYYLRSLGQLFRVAQGLAAPPKPERDLYFDADKKKTANDHMREEFDKGAAYSADIEKTSRKHDELFREKVLGEKERLEILGPEGQTVKTLKAIKGETDGN